MERLLVPVVVTAMIVVGLVGAAAGTLLERIGVRVWGDDE